MLTARPHNIGTTTGIAANDACQLLMHTARTVSSNQHQRTLSSFTLLFQLISPGTETSEFLSNLKYAQICLKFGPHAVIVIVGPS